ncbi:MAG: sugar-binding domain-containing protein [Bacteroidota bacterium]
MKYRLPLFLSLVICIATLPAQTIDLSNQNWHIWLDEAADWENDDLFLPPIDLQKIPTNPPTCSWEKLFDGRGQKTNLPATVEEYFWGKNGSTFGVAGDYLGVSWFVTEIDIPQSFEGKRITLQFESCRMRAEVYLNEKLVGYDLINGTPFEVDITDEAQLGQKNKLAVRITDPNGNFTWRDYDFYTWGKYEILPSHGFGGVTGKVHLTATDPTYIADVFVKNKAEATAIDYEVELATTRLKTRSGQLLLSIFPKGKPENIVLEKKVNQKSFSEKVVVKGSLAPEQVSLWSLEEPNLYTLKLQWMGKNGDEHVVEKNFGFRWFDVKEEKGDKYFALNGKRIVVRTSISWGFWPINGIYPTPELAKEQIDIAQKLGLNMLNFHRGIGQTHILDLADEMGLLYYEEPGGYRPGNSDFIVAWKKEKLLRMVKRDRSHPSLVIYNMINESNRFPKPYEIEHLKAAHQIDETRTITYTSTFPHGEFKEWRQKGLGMLKTPTPIKAHMLPYENEVKNQGWWDFHHAGGPGSYLDNLYKNPKDYLRYSDHPSEIIFFGEEGAIGAPPRLQLIYEQLKDEKKLGWDGNLYLNQYKAYDSFLKEKGFSQAFPDVDALTTQMGNIAMYYQGRIIENIRINNVVDGYVVNGWEDEKIENHSGIVDGFRNPKGDPDILAYYNQPIYVAVKARNKVLPTGSKTIVDFHIVNEVDAKGLHQLNITAKHKGKTFFTKQVDVQLEGGLQYGQLLLEGLEIDLPNQGYTQITADLLKEGQKVANGMESLLTVSLETEKKIGPVAVWDTSGVTQKMLNAVGNINYIDYTIKNDYEESVLLVGEALVPNLANQRAYVRRALLDWVMRGNTLIITQNAPEWADLLNYKEIVDYRGSRPIRNVWYGGSYFVKEHPLFEGLPVNKVFDWEYQSLARYKNDRVGLRMYGEECIVGVSADHKEELLTAVGIIPLGRGKIILSALDLKGPILEGAPASVVAKKVLENYVRFALEN